MGPLLQFLRQFGFLRLGVAAANRGIDDERVLHLFRNRAELKKAYSGLQDEIHRLKERIKQQEGATVRVQEMLQGLEGRLGQTETGYPALVFYQLRELWGQGRTLLTQFVAELAAQQEERERRAFFAERNRRLFARRQAAESTLREAEARAAETRAQVAEIERQLLQLRRFWHYFKRRALRGRLQAAGLTVLLTTQDLEAARAACEQIENEALPEFGGLSLDARRAINLAAIAYGQVLCERLQHTSLVELAREATSLREPPREDYGDRAACEAMMAQIGMARGLLQARGGLQGDVKQRTDRLRELAKYRSGSDTVPTAESLTATMDGSKVLADDLWEIYRVLLR
jgi:hypothetical protein